jgi:hypothetical protein|tara:strand:+ start:163 stop:279 length:117 start_codon:yes stop_codon:yes gene_type:complete
MKLEYINPDDVDQRAEAIRNSSPDGAGAILDYFGLPAK